MAKVPEYQVASTIGDLIEALKKADPSSPWTTDSLNGVYSVVLYDKQGMTVGQIMTRN